MILRACQVHGIHISGELATLKADRKHLALEELLSGETPLSLSSREQVTGNPEAAVENRRLHSLTWGNEGFECIGDFSSIYQQPHSFRIADNPLRKAVQPRIAATWP
jgi:hypothetical protein